MISAQLLTFFALCLCQQDAASVPSTLDRITIYSGQAMVERVFTVTAQGPGQVRVVLSPLPTSSDPDSFQTRLESGDVVMQGLEVSRRVGSLDQSQRGQIRSQLENLRRLLSEVDVDQTAVGDGKKMLANILLSVTKDGIDHFGGMSLSELFDFVAKKSADLDAEQSDIQELRKDLLYQISDLEAQLGEKARSEQRPYREVKLNMFFERAGTAKLRLVYMVTGAGWEPSYDVRVNTDLSSVNVGLVATIHQGTNEDWEDVEVLLSTARPHLGLDPPELPERWAGVYSSRKRGLANVGDAVPSRRGSAELGYVDSKDDAIFAEEMEELAFVAAPSVSVQDYGLTQQFRLPDRVSIAANDEPKQFRLVDVPLDIRPERYVVPSLSQECFLRAEVTSTSDAPLLRGNARIFLGPDYLGEATFPMMLTGDSTTLNLGLDPSLQVDFETVKEERDEPGMFSSILKLTRVFEARLHLSASVNEPIVVLVEDVIPVPRDDRLKIAAIQVHEGALESEKDLKDRKERGIYRWRLRLVPGQDLVMRWGFTAAFNEDLQPIFQED
jgi:uncharacterized protein (TIGR02231 family)